MSAIRKAQPKLFETEAALCAAFLAAIASGDNSRFVRRAPLTDAWTPYAETAGWDILLVRKEDGFQIGVEAKLRLNALVVNQALEEYGAWSAERPAPDCRAVLVPECNSGDFGRIANYLGLSIIRMRGAEFYPALPRLDNRYSADGDWHEWCPAKRHQLPEYVPDVIAGSPAPVQLTAWKISAMKIAITLERRGFLTRADFKNHNIDHRRWLTPGAEWLRAESGRYVRGPQMPNFKAQHPRVYDEIAADSEKWMSTAPLL